MGSGAKRFGALAGDDLVDDIGDVGEAEVAKCPRHPGFWILDWGFWIGRSEGQGGVMGAPEGVGSGVVEADIVGFPGARERRLRGGLFGHGLRIRIGDAGVEVEGLGGTERFWIVDWGIWIWRGPLAGDVVVRPGQVVGCVEIVATNNPANSPLRDAATDGGEHFAHGGIRRIGTKGAGVKARERRARQAGPAGGGERLTVSGAPWVR